MTEVAFHFNAHDRLGYACRLVRKAMASGAKLVVTGPDQTLQALDASLWTLAPTDFLPHCWIDAAPEVLAASPVVLATEPARAVHRQVLINLGPDVPADFDRFERLIEIVSLDDEQRQLARSRWKHYAASGFAMTRHDLAIKGAG